MPITRQLFTQVLAISMLAFFPISLCAQANSQKPKTVTEAKNGKLAMQIEVISPTEYDDSLKIFLEKFTAKLFNDWLINIPDAAKLGEKGRVIVRFQISRDDIRPIVSPALESNSAKKSLNNAALEAVRYNTKSLKLPSTIQPSTIELRAYFSYNCF